MSLALKYYFQAISVLASSGLCTVYHDKNRLTVKIDIWCLFHLLAVIHTVVSHMLRCWLVGQWNGEGPIHGFHCALGYIKCQVDRWHLGPHFLQTTVGLVRGGGHVRSQY